ncbi:MAG TPA: rhomboid family intramembrane serine protease, partial [Pseudonocardia sp.]|nr:rhomboid family intramembrane serine protease [Pseudonocardia sp.]
MPPSDGPPREPAPDESRHRPLVVYLLIAVNVLVYVYTATEASSFQYNSEAPLFEAWSLLPPLVWQGQWWRLVTSGFLHFGLIHLAVNMWSLWVIGKDLERLLGRRRFLMVYFGSLLGGAVIALLFSPANYQIAGASGAVFGLMGGLVAVLAWARLPLRSAIIII